MTHSNDTNITIATYSTDWEAHIAEGVLVNEGIPCMLTNETFSSIYPIGFNSIGGINLIVPAGYADKARSLLGMTGSENMPEQ